jgi:hypothetical protein
VRCLASNVAAAFGARRPLCLGLVFFVTVAVTGSAPALISTPPALALPPPSLTPFQPNVKWGGRTVAVDVSPADSAIAIAASESGGMFKTTDSGATWSHIDSLQPFRMSDVKFDPGNAQIVIATAWGDGRTVNGGGIWRSADGGATWQKPPTADPPSGPLCSSRFNTWGIAFAAGTNDVFVGIDCGVAVSHDLGATWTHVVPDTASSSRAVYAVTAQSGAGGSIVDVCGADGHHRSTDAGATWTPTSAALPACRRVAVHAIAASPLEPNVLFVTTFGPKIDCGGGTATAPSNLVFESDDGGTTWTPRIAPRCISRQPWVAAHLSRDGDPAHIDLYFGTGLNTFRQTCGNTGGPGNRCTTAWNSVSVDHADQNGLGFSPSTNCAQFIVSDGGVHKTSDCGATWTITGSGAAGYNALQLYEVDGQVHPSHTDLYIGTQDNDIWASGDNGVTWPGKRCCEGFFFEMTHASPTDVGQTVTGVKCFTCSNFRSAAHVASLGGWSNPPGQVVGNPFLISAGTYIQFTQPNPPASTLNVTTDTGANWSPVGTIAQSLSGRPYIAGPPANPTIYQAILKPGGQTGLLKITGSLTGTATITPADTGLNTIATYCMGQGTFVCPTVFGVDPNNPQHLIAADAGANQMMVSTNGGASWAPDPTLTTLVTGLGQFSFDLPNINNINLNILGSEAHTIAFDPANGNRILVGTEAAGIIASLDGGATWTTLFQSGQVGAITSFAFDEVRSDVFASSYGRGLWKVSFVARPTTLTYTGDTTADYHDPATLAAVVTDPATSLPVPGATITFTLGAQTCTATTDVTGRAACVLTLNQVPGNYTVTANYAGNGLLLPSTASSPFTITREETTLTYTGDTLIANGTTAHLAGVLAEDGTVPIAARTVTFTLGGGASAQTCSAVTGASGTASCDIGPVAQPLGSGTLTAEFAGDAFYLPSSDTEATLVFAFLARGAFVVGDGSATGAVTFWAAQWAALNSLSGGPAPSSFKGFAETLGSSPPACGGSWSTGPGNSSGPPASVPSFMGVLVASAVSKAGPTISGDIRRIVVITTNSGYGPNPGQAGTGTIIAEVCHL